MVDFTKIVEPRILKGNRQVAYRDPAAHYHDGIFRVFHTLCEYDDGGYYFYLAVTESRDLINWTPSQKLTQRNLDHNYSSPGNIVRFQDQWVLCFQTYPTSRKEQATGDQRARIWRMVSDDLRHWRDPELMRVKGPQVPIDQMGRMIDPYLIRDKDTPEKWWCFYKQNGASMSYSYDLDTWTYFGRVDAGENVCVLVEGDEYVMFHSPENGFGIKRSPDVENWRDVRLETLGQAEWDWAHGRITAAHILDLRDQPEIGKYIMFFHGSVPAIEGVLPETHGAASLGMAWSDNLVSWKWSTDG